ncbi:peptidase T [Cellulophaga omnivescoria]|uniref:peptidase T n=1 Tax=Cellulophaga omnivescoria TaxID=1888890 RepID=UPI0009849CFE|nr:peptidase T [Cellulophaga omnivescoria]WBU89536.1 peptidase T [Cellulophaga omnivescoria]
MQDILDRFLGYVKIDTQSDASSNTTPSTAKQWDLANKLVTELKEIGMQDVTIDDNAYIMATLPSNIDKEVPTIGFIAHFDTTPDFSGTHVNPQIIRNYNGKDIVLNADKNIILSPDYFEDLLQYKGQTLVTTDGTTLLGADDKAGITEIVSAMEFLIAHPEIKHGKIRIGFTPDEEIGRGAHKFDVEKFGAEWAYTMDGSQIGELEYENFNAAGASIKIQGKSVHPGYAKGKMINAIGIAQEIMAALPNKEVPEHTSGREGFYHIHTIKGEIENAELDLIIRDHERSSFEDRKKTLETIVFRLNEKYNNCIELSIKDQYFNMKEKVMPVYHIVETAKEAMEALNITPIIKPIRGGTDGSQLSYMGLPCPNIFAGGHNFHGKYEYVPVESMEKAVEVIVKICELTATK